MNRRRVALAALTLSLGLVTAVVGSWPAERAPTPEAPPRAALRAPERARRPRAERPRPAPRAVREESATVRPASVTAAAAAAPAATATRVEQLATTVLAAAVQNDWMVVDEHDTPCPPDKLRIVYDAPPDLASYARGAYFEPLRPPQGSDDEVNGLLLCEGSSFLYRGFEAYFRADRGQWDVFPFPVIE